MARPNDVGVGVGIILLRGQQEVLLLRRKGSHGAGTWAFPGGWVDRTDTQPLDVAKREAMEEVGVTGHHAELLGVTSEDHPDFRTVTLYFIAAAWDGEPGICEPEKCSEILWHPIFAALPEPAFPGLVESMDQLRAQHPLVAGLEPVRSLWQVIESTERAQARKE